MTLLQLVFAAIAVVVIIYLSYTVSKTIATGSARINAAKYMKIIDRIPVGQDRSILILQIGDKRYLVSNTARAVEILAELDPEEIVELPQERGMLEQMNGTSFKKVLDDWMKKKEQ